MAFMGGAECSTASNPLTQFTKHVQDDRSSQRDRLTSRGPGGQFEGIRNQRSMGQHDQMMDDFMRQKGSVPPMAPSFAMEQMQKNLESLSVGQSRTHSPSWAAEYGVGQPHHDQMTASFQRASANGQVAHGFNPAEFRRFQQREQSSPAPLHASLQGPAVMSGFHRPPLGMGLGGQFPLMGAGYKRPDSRQMAEPSTKAKGKGRLVELDERNWEQEFAQIDAVDHFEQTDETDAAIEAELNNVDRSVVSETNELGDFESIWASIQAERQANRHLFDDELGWNDMDMSDFNPWENFDAINTHGGFRDPQLGEYLFEEDNVFQGVANPFEEGLRIMEQFGNLSLAALAFEAAVQKDPQHVAAWNMLGSAQAQNEKESPAIRALEQALQLDPSNLDALMGLAVSYTNESYEVTAYRTLERWLSVKYPQIVSPQSLSASNEMGFTDRSQLHEKVTQLFIKAAQLSPNGKQMDPDVQVGLGVLFYGVEEHGKAVDCFEAALASTESGTTNQRQQLHLLWNRLGATLANSDRSEQAIAAYERALHINPNFVRARYNLGVSCINIHCYEEAAQHLLGALSMHQVVEKEGLQRVREVVGNGVSDQNLEHLVSMNQSTNLYMTLRRVFESMNRPDLSEMVVPGMDVEGFRKEFDF